MIHVALYVSVLLATTSNEETMTQASSRFSRNSEANASDFPENPEEKCIADYSHGDSNLQPHLKPILAGFNVCIDYMVTYLCHINK